MICVTDALGGAVGGAVDGGGCVGSRGGAVPGVGTVPGAPVSGVPAAPPVVVVAGGAAVTPAPGGEVAPGCVTIGVTALGAGDVPGGAGRVVVCVPNGAAI